MESSSTKRKPQRISKLEESVINRIAAGEIIHRPANALKELLENSLDANSTNIQVVAKEGGMKLLQIIDNGDGIHKEDLELLCERFTTSKIKNYEDLETIQTYGFRGEALASISHVSHLTVVTKTRENVCCNSCRVKYLNGKMYTPDADKNAEPKSCAGNDGTQIIVEDLFYNIPYRKQALKKANEEYTRILDVVGKYAIHNAGVAFSCRKIGAKTTGSDIQTSLNASKLDVIQQIYGRSVHTCLEYFENDMRESPLAVQFEGYASGDKFTSKKTTLLLFINNRLVDNTAIRTAIEQLYFSTFPKSPKPFVYLSLNIRPQYVDVNVHPTKKEVYFLNQDLIINEIIKTLQSLLVKINTSQTFSLQQNIKPLLNNSSNIDNQKVTNSTKALNMYIKQDAGSAKKKIHESKLVRMDSKNLSLHSFIFKEASDKDDISLHNNENKNSKSNSTVFGSPLGFRSMAHTKDDYNDDLVLSPSSKYNDKKSENSPSNRLSRFLLKPNDDSSTAITAMGDMSRISIEDSMSKTNSIDTFETKKIEEKSIFINEKPNDVIKENRENVKIAEKEMNTQKINNDDEPNSTNLKPRVEVQLGSILELRAEWAEARHLEFSKILCGHVFVGFLDTNRALIQYETGLYMVDYNQISEALFYQLILSEFNNFGKIELQPAANICDLVLLALQSEIDYNSELSKGILESQSDIKIDFEPLPNEIVENPNAVAKAITDLIISRKEMLEEYFNMKITETGELESLPMIIRDYIPNMNKLPLFLLRLGSEINWEDEKNFFQSFASELAYFYATEPPSEIDKNINEDVSQGKNDNVEFEHKMQKDKSENPQLERFYHVVEYRIFPSLKAGFSAPNSIVDSNSIYEIAKLPDLYKIFERC
ncbi:hypothetical protein BB561_003334 [Smittium simulii]|uniref:DNA mismatch repair protein S5 domain-containing protein n=1 Tax=Smittium simulii TaxID=133385 RepID=A0A2T9YM53_9FUNG|nr:hypothetical protein BB561_003334 [Smittium simulii]